MQEAFDSTVDPVEMVTVFAEADSNGVDITGTDYSAIGSNKVLSLSNGQCVTFGNGQITVASCAP